MGGPFLIEAEPNGVCDLCDKAAETRPFGPNGEEVCYTCGMKDLAAVERGVAKFIFGEVK